MDIKVFIECEAGSDQRPFFDEDTLEQKGIFVVSRKYPFPYGFIRNTKSGDGDCLDCFVITTQPLQSKSIVDGEVIGMMQQFETKNGITKEDHKILATLKGENAMVDEEVKNLLREFGLHVFDHRIDKKVEIGNFYSLEEALELIRETKMQFEEALWE